MIDVHAHVVFGVDDGAKTIEESVEMLKEAYNSGFKRVITTPHYIEDYYECNKKDIEQKILLIKQKLNEINCPIEILQGNEIYITENINKLIEEQKATTLGNSKYVLFELPLNSEVMNLNKVIYQILEKGLVPVLAHPERYPFVQNNPNTLLPLIEQGVIIQSNYGSIINQYGKKANHTIKKMLECNMVHLLGSDVHRPQTIYSNINSAKMKIEKIIGQERMKKIIHTNCENIINGKKIEVEEPVPIKKKILHNLFSK